MPCPGLALVEGTLQLVGESFELFWLSKLTGEYLVRFAVDG